MDRGNYPESRDPMENGQDDIGTNFKVSEILDHVSKFKSLVSGDIYIHRDVKQDPTFYAICKDNFSKKCNFLTKEIADEFKLIDKARNDFYSSQGDLSKMIKYLQFASNLPSALVSNESNIVYTSKLKFPNVKIIKGLESEEIISMYNYGIIALCQSQELEFKNYENCQNARRLLLEAHACFVKVHELRQGVVASKNIEIFPNFELKWLSYLIELSLFKMSIIDLVDSIEYNPQSVGEKAKFCMSACVELIDVTKKYKDFDNGNIEKFKKFYKFLELGAALLFIRFISNDPERLGELIGAYQFILDPKEKRLAPRTQEYDQCQYGFSYAIEKNKIYQSPIQEFSTSLCSINSADFPTFESIFIEGVEIPFRSKILPEDKFDIYMNFKKTIQSQNSETFKEIHKLANRMQLELNNFTKYTFTTAPDKTGQLKVLFTQIQSANGFTKNIDKDFTDEFKILNERLDNLLELGNKDLKEKVEKLRRNLTSLRESLLAKRTPKAINNNKYLLEKISNDQSWDKFFNSYIKRDMNRNICKEHFQSMQNCHSNMLELSKRENNFSHEACRKSYQQMLHQSGNEEPFDVISDSYMSIIAEKEKHESIFATSKKDLDTLVERMIRVQGQNNKTLICNPSSVTYFMRLSDFNSGLKDYEKLKSKLSLIKSEISKLENKYQISSSQPKEHEQDQFDFKQTDEIEISSDSEEAEVKKYTFSNTNLDEFRSKEPQYESTGYAVKLDDHPATFKNENISKQMNNMSINDRAIPAPLFSNHDYSDYPNNNEHYNYGAQQVYPQLNEPQGQKFNQQTVKNETHLQEYRNPNYMQQPRDLPSHEYIWPEESNGRPQSRNFDSRSQPPPYPGNELYKNNFNDDWKKDIPAPVYDNSQRHQYLPDPSRYASNNVKIDHIHSNYSKNDPQVQMNMRGMQPAPRDHNNMDYIHPRDYKNMGYVFEYNSTYIPPNYLRNGVKPQNFDQKVEIDNQSQNKSSNYPMYASDYQNNEQQHQKQDKNLHNQQNNQNRSQFSSNPEYLAKMQQESFRANPADKKPSSTMQQPAQDMINKHKEVRTDIAPVPFKNKAPHDYYYNQSRNTQDHKYNPDMQPNVNMVNPEQRLPERQFNFPYNPGEKQNFGQPQAAPKPYNDNRQQYQESSSYFDQYNKPRNPNYPSNRDSKNLQGYEEASPRYPSHYINPNVAPSPFPSKGQMDSQANNLNNDQMPQQHHQYGQNPNQYNYRPEAFKGHVPQPYPGQSPYPNAPPYINYANSFPNQQIGNQQNQYDNQNMNYRNYQHQQRRN